MRRKQGADFRNEIRNDLGYRIGDAGTTRLRRSPDGIEIIILIRQCRRKPFVPFDQLTRKWMRSRRAEQSARIEQRRTVMARLAMSFGAGPRPNLQIG